MQNLEFMPLKGRFYAIIPFRPKGNILHQSPHFYVCI